MFTALFHSLIFSQILGLYFIIVAMIMMIRIDFYRHFIMNLKAGSGVIILAASFSLIVGLMLVVVHNIWVLEPQVIITLLGWLLVILAILWLSIPEKMTHFSRLVYSGKGYYVLVLFTLFIGILLLTKGFYHYM
ncbi:TPA: hypothetical protein ACPSKE_001748 [Legionella feeleii]|uniref:Integral membrane protein (PIN domain superfamily) n=1 Tax=Legionella feeleii TaxID=453 RepID=A0A0W0U098_9GAMM|nr:hypothetical protein [Legionella feeleii]KTD01422.1 Integral membrane protein (PIN domain superfamily) [Legionella feeleii]SPX61230.1 Integral membrane protein (PIN domain superfamily) [Legionella feeleii]